MNKTPTFDDECIDILRELQEKRDRVYRRLGETEGRVATLDADMAAVQRSLKLYRERRENANGSD